VKVRCRFNLNDDDANLSEESSSEEDGGKQETPEERSECKHVACVKGYQRCIVDHQSSMVQAVVF
jgi:hypothetical protein